ncbi:chemotaxis protein CheW [Piscinibacter gummiphilus]|uniref:Uncharacterized protein n=1 Tax=Piscinibacter gummiphilus TaxID=946333 RepID=A0A1W6LBT6_9BURK|nr:chemotaxis protein CheW [Piscinibacter gummiphilus]ARN21628.1 hypothetical protein A4W93_17970 [Piscinibacter gummiphilus]GLS95808.1 hypothetical protein GCM10007918_31000 [Piscinibacter gummiphilus]
MSKVWRKGVPFDPSVAPLVARMGLVDEYRETLQRLHGTWDTLALLGQMSGSMAEIAQTREQFQSLSHVLLDSLARQQLRDALQSLRGTAQVAIDVLVRNLFERTADVGFLSTDAAVRDLVAGRLEREALEARFAAYVAKYSVYDDVVVLDGAGSVLARLDRSAAGTRCDEAWVAEAQRPGVPYVERFGTTSLLDGRRGLLYAAAIPGGGVLCLSFRFDDEMARLFARLSDDHGGSVVALLDGQGRVTASSDTWQLPVGVTVPPVPEGRHVVRLAGRDYLAVRAPATGFQGYDGPGWTGLALVPADLAFPDVGQESGTPLARDLDTRDVFDEELRGIPLQAEGIQRALAQSVWNGKLQLGRGAAGQAANGLAAALLKEVSATGDRIRTVFRDAIARLQATALSSILSQARFQAGLAIEIVDRNLYERANDCRWWALSDDLGQALKDPAAAARAGDVLRHINGLYTVYSLLVLFDAQGTVVAVSDPSRADLVGQPLDASLVRATLALRDPQAYHVTPHEPTPLAGGASTLVYTAALGTAGGVAIVFDGAAQFTAMLKDALPDVPGASGLLVDRAGRVVATTDERFAVGSVAPVPAALLSGERGASVHEVVEIDGVMYAMGVGQSSGYREYRSGGDRRPDELMAVVLMRLGQRRSGEAGDMGGFEARGPAAVANPRDIATFVVAGAWHGLAAESVEQGLSARHVTPLPNARPHVLGLVPWQDEMIAVVDLAAWLTNRPAPRGDGPLIVCRAPRGRRIALRVEALGDVLAVASASLQAWQSPVDGSPLHLLSGEVGGQAGMLTVLSLDRLMAAVGEAQAVDA